jgi:hypothetical protein
MNNCDVFLKLKSKQMVMVIGPGNLQVD